MANQGFPYGSHMKPVKVKEMDVGDEWWNNSAPSAAKEIMNDTMGVDIPRRPGETVHAREEPDTTGTYNSGGRVQKFGSSTHVTCKSKSHG